MKRILAIILVAILALTLISCSNSGTTASPSASAPASPSASVPASVEPSPSPSETEKDTIGYLTDKVDHFNRDPFKLASMALNTSTTYTQMINDNLTKWGTVFNYDITIYNANMDYDGYINTISVYAEQGYDGLVVGMDDALLPRIYEITQELKIPTVGMPTAYTDPDGHIIWPSVNQDEYANGALCMQWLADNYKNYWMDPIDEATLGLIVLDFSVVSGIHAREPGVHDTFVKEFPKAADNYFIGDLVSLENGFSVQGGNLMTSTIIAGHPEITKWFVVGLVDDWSLGATRAVEALGKEADVLVVSDQADAFINELNSGAKGNVYVGACAVSTAELTSYCAANLVTILEGRATPETIWPEWVRSGDKYPCIDVTGTMLTKDNYQKWLTDTSFETMSKGMKTS